jgi:hypothetical protein
MYDFLGSLESSAEYRYDEMTKDLPRGKFRCGCGEIDDIDNATTASANPYSDMICGKCQLKLWPDMDK